MRLNSTALALAVMLFGQVAFGANADWNTGTSNWDTPANWTGGTGLGGRPGAADTARILNGGTAQITGVLTVPTINELRIGQAGGTSGNLVQSVGTLTGTGTFAIAENGGSTGSYTLNSGSVATSGEFWVGQDGNATFTQNGGSVSTTGGGWLHIARGGSSVSTYNLSAGTVTANTNMGIGENGKGTLNMMGGSLSVLNGILYAPANGTGTINQSGGTISVQEIRISDGGAGNGTYNQSGGTLSVGNNNGWFHLARQGTATYNLSGSGIINMSGNGHFSLGEFGSGTLNITGSAAQVNLGPSTDVDFRAAPDTLRFNLGNGGASKINTSGTLSSFQGNLDVDLAAGVALFSTPTHVLVNSTVNAFTDNSVFSEGLWTKSNPGGKSEQIDLKAASQLAGSPIALNGTTGPFAATDQKWAQINGLTPGIDFKVELDLSTNALLGDILNFLNNNGQNASLIPGGGPFDISLRFTPTTTSAFFAWDFSDFNVANGTITQVQNLRTVATPEPSSVALWAVMGLAGAWFAARRMKRKSRVAQAER